MDLFLRRVYFAVAAVLIILWIVMFAWVVGIIKPDVIPWVSPPIPKSSENFLGISNHLRVPGITFSTYSTSPGETFASLSRKLGILESTLRSLNQANDESEPKSGNIILIPSKDGIYHIVRAGQGLSDIARSYGISLKVVLKANQKRGDADLHPDDVLILPGARYLTKQSGAWISLASLELKKGFLKPTTGRFADGFGERIHPITGKMTFHEGLDLAPGWRARVVAAQDGKVIFASIRAGYGRLIILDHGSGLTSWYAHLDELLVKVPMPVKRGDLIGKVGKSGRTTGPHLHFEIRLNGKPQNPFLYLSQ
jgi:murein DD-endopeptidase MepM/ murein hydrolase activator NlpD